MDMSKFIIAKSDQLNSDDLMGGPITVTITSVRGTDASDQPVAVHFDGDDGKPYKPCKSMRRVMVGVWGADASKYVGKSMTLYREAEVQFGGMKVGGIRISHMSGLTEKKTLALTATRGKKGLHTVHPLADAPQSTAQDFSDQLAQLKASAAPGATEALKAAWEAIGKDARKALAAELPALQAICAQPADDVAFDAPAPDSDPLRTTLRRIEDAKDLATVDAIERETEDDRAFLSDEQCDRLDATLSTRRAELRQSEDA